MTSRCLHVDMLVCWLAVAILAGCASPGVGGTKGPDAIGSGAYLLRGTFAANRQPDGNTVLLEGRTGLIVFDTGRHPEQAEKIAAFARSRNRPVLAIFNSHWHLDHISGNIPLKATWPYAKVYSNDPALSEALRTFLAQGAEFNRKRLADPDTPADQREDARIDLATVEQGRMLHPDISLERDQVLMIDGRRLEVHTAAGASAGDVWIYDPRARLVAAGDLITLPAPFLDTACPAKWTAALGDVLAVPFERVAPGHGRIMTRGDVERYRDAFDALIVCARGDLSAETCAGAWADAASPLQDAPSGDRAAAARYAAYYVTEILRKPSRRADCGG
ncbi:MAG: MBL fold metallo-hydrolase [Alphaproteobacteria bacterium]|nr:MBL fold metallo-hydrolase [Alphaproteobacteria bacterium]